MAVKNEIAVWIDGINRTPNFVYPLKIGNFLDERLDECYVSLRLIDEGHFAPLTPVEVQISNTLYFGSFSETIEETLYLVAANDDAHEVIVGSGRYNHELYCIEVTKVAECCVVDTLTFTNDFGRTYTNNANYAVPQWETTS